MCRQRFFNEELIWSFNQISGHYPDSPAKIWCKQQGLDFRKPQCLPLEVRAEEEKYQARIQNGLDLMGEFLVEFWRRGRGN